MRSRKDSFFFSIKATVFILLLLVLLTPRFFVALSLNEGYLHLFRAVLNTPGKPDYFLFKGSTNETEHLAAAGRAFDRVIQQDPENEPALWGKSRTALAAGRADEAVRLLPVRSTWRNHLLFLDTLLAHSLVKDIQSVTQLYQQYRNQQLPVWEDVILNIIALSYLNQAKEEIQSGDFESAIPALEEVLKYRPFDLYANYFLYREASRQGNISEADTYRQNLLYFSPDAVIVKDQRLLEFVFDIFPELIAEDLWGKDRGLNLVSYWVWQHPRSSAVHRLLEDLAKQYPEQEQWMHLLGELYQRQGLIGQAQLRGQGTLKASSGNPEVQLSVQPGSTFPGLRTAAIEEEQEIAAWMLGLQPGNVRIGSNRIPGGSVPKELAEGPRGWEYEVYHGPEGHAFVSSIDTLEGIETTRITNLWWPQVSSSDGYYAQYSSPLDVPEDTEWLLLSFIYKETGKPDDIGLAFLGTWQGDVPHIVHLALPDTSGEWTQVYVIGKVVESSSDLVSIVRNWGTANIWFSNVQVRPLEIAGIPVHCREEACIFTRNQE